VTDLNVEERAFDLLQWVPYCLPSQYDEEEAICGKYSAIQKERSDVALDAWDLQHPYESSDELTAFRELQRLGVYTDENYFSPSLAKDAFYRKTLTEHTATTGSTNRPSPPRRKGDSGTEGTGLDATNAKQGFRPRRSRRRSRP
tara:strand:+ start:467 stop:898 length:432 start_codon:yes stop_codon:yes gene_type:complete